MPKRKKTSLRRASKRETFRTVDENKLYTFRYYKGSGEVTKVLKRKGKR